VIEKPQFVCGDVHLHVRHDSTLVRLWASNTSDWEKDPAGGKRKGLLLYAHEVPKIVRAMVSQMKANGLDEQEIRRVMGLTS
jgi:hypothetical protein